VWPCQKQTKSNYLEEIKAFDEDFSLNDILLSSIAEFLHLIKVSKCSLRTMIKKNSHLYLPAEILLGCNEDFSLRKTKDSSIIRIPMVNGDRLYSSLDDDSCALPVTFFHHLHDCRSIFKV